MSKTDFLRVSEYLRHIIEAVERIDRYTTDMTEVQFLDDEKTQGAVVRNFEIIGEAVTASRKNIRTLPPCTMKFLGDLITRCAMPWHMDTTR